MPIGTIVIIWNGVRRCDMERKRGPPKTLHRPWVRWGDVRVFAQMMNELASKGYVQKTSMIDAT